MILKQILVDLCHDFNFNSYYFILWVISISYKCTAAKIMFSSWCCFYCFSFVPYAKLHSWDSTILVVDLILFHKCGISCKANILSYPCGWFYIILFLICFIFQLHSWDSVTPVWLIWIARTVSPNACLCETAAALLTWVKAGVWTSRYASPAPHLDQVRSQCLIFATLCLSFSLKRIFELSEFASLK